MAEKWIWLGDASLLDAGNNLLAPPSSNSVFAFLAHDDASPANPFELRLLIRKTAAAVFGWFGVFGDIDPTKGPTLADWTTLVLPNTWRWTQSTTLTFANAQPAFNLPAGLNLDVLEIAAEIGILSITATAPVITAAASPLVSVTLKIAPATKQFKITGTPTGLLILLELENGGLTGNGTQIVGDDGTPIDLELGAAGSGLRLLSFTDSLGEGERIGVEFPVPAEVTTAVPIRRAGSGLVFSWKPADLLVRMHVALGGGAAAGLLADVVVARDDDPTCSVQFELPLVESPSAVDRPDSTPRLLLTKPTGDGAAEAFETFKFRVELSAGAGDAGKPILRFELSADGHITELADTIKFVRELRGKFLQHVANVERALTSVFGKVDDLTGDDSSVQFAISELNDNFKDAKAVFTRLKAKLNDFPLPLQLTVTLADRTWVFIALARLDLWNGRMKDNRIFVSAVPLGNKKVRTIDLSVFALVSPGPIDLDLFARELEERFTAAAGGPVDFESLDRDGYLDVARGELILDFQRKESDSSRAMKLIFPGDIPDGDEKYADRVVLRTEAFDPDNWPDQVDKAKGVHLRLGSRGLSLFARVDTGHAAVIGIGSGPGLRLSLERERGKIRSELVVVNNQVRLGTMVGKLEAPGFQGLQVDLLLGLRQTDAEKPPTIFAEMDLSRPRAQLLKMTVPGLRGRVDAVHLKLAWNGSDWTTDLTADGSISFLGFGKTSGMSGLDNPDTLPFQNLDLLEFRKGRFDLPLRRTRERGLSQSDPESPASGAVGVGHWEILDGLIAVECTDVTLTIDFADISTLKLNSARLTVKRPRLEFHGGTSLDVAVETDELQISWSSTDKLKLSFSGLIGFEIRIGPNIAFEGKGGWVDTPQEHYFAASGSLRCAAFPNIEAAIKLGSGRKSNGRNVPNIVVYGSFEFEADLFPGVVLKRIGAGLSINNRLAALGRDPEPREILARLDQIRPEQIDNWRFDPEGDLYVALIASAWAGSNRGGDAVVNAYVMSLTMIVDTNLDVVAAGEVWLFSSLKKVREPANRSRPAMAGVLVFRPRKKTLSFVAETRPNPFIEANDQLAKVLSQCTARFSFYVSEDLVDYFLEEVSYRESFLGAEVQATGGFRIAIGRFGVLLRAWLHLQGDLPERKLEQPGVGGFSFRGSFFLDADFGGLIASDGVSAYGSVAAGLEFRVTAFVMIPTPRIEMRRYEETISFTISYPTFDCGRWGCSTDWHDETIEETIIVDVPEVVIRNEPYDLPETGIDLYLAGEVGFDSGGQIGFRGTISIDVNILGQPLSISPKLDVQGGIIDKVKRRVAAVEQSVNKLRNLPRPAPTGAADGDDTPAPEKWTLYERTVGGVKRCVIVPSPESENGGWYAPEVGNLSVDYATFPRDTTLAVDSPNRGAASAVERLHPTPLRDTVVRMIIPIKPDSNPNSAPTRLLDLIMPWDRANMDALPEPPGSETDRKRTSAARLRALKKINQIEAEMTAGAVEAVEQASLSAVSDELRRRRFRPEGITVVRDPRIGSNDRRFWKLVDQLERPEWAPPAEFRSVSELTALGIAPPPRRGAGDASLQAVFDFDRLREQGLRAARHNSGSPTEATRILQTRSSFLAAVLNDFQRFPGPDPESHYATNAYDDPHRESRQMLVERTLDLGKRVLPNDPQPKRAITRRRLPFICRPITPADPSKFEFQLLRELLSGATNFVFGQGKIPLDAKFKVTWNSGTGEQTDDLDSTPLLLTFEDVDAVPVQMIAKVRLVDVPDGYTGVTEDFIFIELHPDYPDGIDRKIGLIFELKDSESIDLEGVRIVRNPTHTDADATAIDKWFEIIKPQWEASAELQSDPSAGLHRTVVPLTPCQTFIPTNASQNDTTAPAVFPTTGRLQVRLPVLFTEEFFKSFFARINRFEILRKFDWETAPVSLGEYPFSAIRWSAGDERYIMPRSFLATDDFAVEGVGDGWRFLDPRIRPGTPIVQYFLRAVPFGESARSISNVLPVAWPSKVALYLPARCEPLPTLAIIFEAGSLLEPDAVAAQPKFALFDGRGVPFAERSSSAAGQEDVRLELWVKPERIVPSGFYAPGDELTPEASRAATDVRAPSDLPIAPLPEDTDGKHHYGTVTFAAADSTIDSESNRFKRTQFELSPGFRYRWYVRPEADVRDRRVLPLEQYVSREIPKAVNRDTRLLAVDGLELVGKGESKRILLPLGIFPRATEQSPRWHTRSSLKFQVLDEVLCRGDLPVVEKRQLARPTRLFWESLEDALDGGVELIFQDSFDSNRVDRRLVEVHGEAVFARSQTDFRLAGSWQAHPQHDSGRLWRPLPPSRIVNAEDSWKYFVWTSPFNPLLSRLVKTRADIVQVLDEVVSSPSPAADWRTLHQAITNWFAVVNIYFRSPVVLDAAGEEADVDLVFAKVRNLFLGLPEPQATGSSLQDYEAQLVAVLAAMDDIDRRDPRRESIRDVDGDEVEVFKQRLLDHEIASRLAEVIRGRLRIADALREFTLGGTVDLPEADDPVEKWPRYGEWTTHAKRWLVDLENSEIAAQRPLSSALLNLFQFKDTPTMLDGLNLYNRAAVSVLARFQPNGFFTTLEKLGLAFDKTGITEPQQNEIGEQLAGRVNEAAGLAAAIAGISSVAQPRGWRLVRRPHHQLTPEGAAQTQAGEKDSLANYVSHLARAADAETFAAIPDPMPAEGVVHYFNWLERMGFALDLALVDEDNRYFAQRELIAQLQALDWKQLLDDVEPRDAAEYRVYILTGREPDTVLPHVEDRQLFDDDDALGYAFVKLAVVPVDLLRDLSATSAFVTVSAAPAGNVVTLGVNPDAERFGPASEGKVKLVVTRLKAAAIGAIALLEEPADVGSQDVLGNVLTIVAHGPTPIQLGDELRLEAAAATNSRLDKWFELRGIDVPADSAERLTRLLTSLAMGADELALDEVNHTQLIVVEPWARRWQTVPSVGRLSHISHSFLDRSGRTTLLAGRRVSRYEPFLRWLGSANLPRVERLTGLGEECLLSITHRRRLLAGEEPRTLPVTVHPHPSRIEFLYRLPPSAARSILSAEARRRTGFLECQVAFTCVPPTTKQVFDTALFPDAATFPIPTLVPAGDTALLINPIAGKQPADLDESVMLWPANFPTDVAFIKKAGIDVADPSKWKLTFSRGLPPIAASTRVISVKPPGDSASANPLCPQVGFHRVVQGGGSVEFRILGTPHPESMVGSYAIITDETSGARDAVLIEGYDPIRRAATLKPVSAFRDGTLNVVRWESRPEAYPIPVAAGADPLELFRHERLISLVGLPYYHGYRAGVEARFAADRADDAVPLTADLSAEARRLPGWVLCHPSRITVDPLEVTLFLNRLGDALDPAEMQEALRLDSTEHTHTIAGVTETLPTRHLLDTEVKYQLWITLLPSRDDEDAEPSITKIADIVLATTGETPNATITAFHKIKVDGSSVPITMDVNVTPFITNAAPVYWIRFVLDIGTAVESIKPILKDPKFYRLMAIHFGYESPMVKFHTEAP